MSTFENTAALQQADWLLFTSKCSFCGDRFRYRVSDNFNGILHSDTACSVPCSEGRLSELSDRLLLDKDICPKLVPGEPDYVMRRATVQTRVCRGCGETFDIRPQDNFNGYSYSDTHCSPACLKTNGTAAYDVVLAERKRPDMNKPNNMPFKKNGKRLKYKAPVTLPPRTYVPKKTTRQGTTKTEYRSVIVGDRVEAKLVTEQETKRCPHPEKKVYPTKDAGWDFIRTHHKGDYLITPYDCVCGKIHLGH